MKNHITRTTLIASVHKLLKAWQTQHEEELTNSYTSTATLQSSAHGTLTTNKAIAKQLSTDFQNTETQLFSSNHCTAYLPEEDIYLVVTYVYGTLQETNQQFTTFGATVLWWFSLDSDVFRVTQQKLQLQWISGNTALFKGWKFPKGNRFWQVGDAEDIIVSELDAPWQQYPSLQLLGTEEELIAQAFTKYAWAIDQADFTLLGQTFTEDAHGAFHPMGNLNGKHQIIATMKAFRQPWPWMQHFGKALHINIHSNGTEATLLVGRMIPQEPATILNEVQYGAHYRFTMRKEHGDWKIYKYSYVGGWFSSVADIV